MRQFTRKTIKAFIAANAIDGTLETTLTTERNELALELLNNPEAATEIVSGSGNGVSFAGQVSMTKTERLDFLQWVLEALASGQVPANTTYARFC
jgi:hypothetical protein